MKHLLRAIAYRCTSKRIDENKLDVVHISLGQNDISYFNLSSNPIISFNYNGELFYFRECQEIKGLKEYYFDAIDNFFDSINRLGISKEHFKQDMPIRLDFSQKETESFKKYIDAKKKDNSFLKAMSDADAISSKNRFSIWENQSYESGFFHSFDLNDINPEHYDIAVYFLWYMRSASSGYKMMKITRGQSHSFFAAVRSVASKIMAEELGLENMITDTVWCELDIQNGKKKFGVLSNAAKGSRMVDVDVSPDGKLQRELLKLNVLDVICNQPDHGPNNYNIICTENGYSVCAFDNDNPKTFFPIPTINGVLAGCVPFADKDGMIRRPYFDRELAEKLESLDMARLKKRLKPYLNGIQLWAVTVRIKKLKNAVNKTKEINNKFLLESYEWNDFTVRKEVESGTTYITRALKTD